MNKIKDNIVYILLALLIIAITASITLINSNSKLKREIKLDQYNYSVATDTIKKHYDNKLKTYISEKESYYLNNIDDLKKYNVNLYDDLRKYKGLYSSIESKISINNNTFKPVKDSIINTAPNSYSLPFSFNYSDAAFQQIIKGKTSLKINDDKPIEAVTQLDSNIIRLKLQYNIVNKEDKYIVQAVCSSPFIQFTDLNAVTLEKPILKPCKQSKISIGTNIGWGVNSDNRGGNLRIGWYFGIGINYKLIGK